MDVVRMDTAVCSPPPLLPPRRPSVQASASSSNTPGDGKGCVGRREPAVDRRLQQDLGDLVAAHPVPLRTRMCISSSSERPSATSMATVMQLRVRAFSPGRVQTSPHAIWETRSWKPAVAGVRAPIGPVDVLVAEHPPPQPGRRRSAAGPHRCDSTASVTRAALLDVGQMGRSRQHDER